MYDALLIMWFHSYPRTVWWWCVVVVINFLVYEIEALFSTSSDAIFPTRKDDLEGAARSNPCKASNT